MLNTSDVGGSWHHQQRSRSRTLDIRVWQLHTCRQRLCAAIMLWTHTPDCERTLVRRRPKALPEPASVAHAAVPAMRAAEKPPSCLSTPSPSGCLRWRIVEREVTVRKGN